MYRIFFALFCFFSTLHAQNPLYDFIVNGACQMRSSVYGWCSEQKALSFVDLVLEVEPDVCVEIGVCGGSSLLPVALALKAVGKGVVIGIDPWDNEESTKYHDPIEHPEDYHFWSYIDLKGIYRDFCHALHFNKLAAYCIAMVATSEKARPFIPPIDILYIDGAHSEIAAAKDVELYLPLVKSGGYIWINDVIWDQMQLAVDTLEDACEFVKSIDDGNCFLFRKR